VIIVDVIEILEAFLLLYLGICLGYLTLLTLLAFVMRSRTIPAGPSQRRFAFVVPAHNEEGVVGSTLSSLKAVDYPADRFLIVVIADNCTDGTAEEARQAGARVMERTNPAERGKGYALRWCFDSLLGEQPRVDAFVVIDADTVVEKNLLKTFDAHLETGAQVVQCADLVKPAPGAWSAEMTRLGFMLYNYIRPLGRTAFDGSAGLKGNGMCFRREVFERHPWNAFTRAEDLEYGLQLLLKGIPARFAPESTILATMPTNEANAESQRARWEGGRLPLIRNYAGKLLVRAVARFSLPSFDAFLELITPALVNMIAVALAMGLVSLVLLASGWSTWIFLPLLWFLLVCLGVFHLLAGVSLYGDPDLLRAVQYLPRYVAWKILLYAKLARKKGDDGTWVRTTREG
jgi:cellulose synthase/poly-beta-1,6-N-acetylglucosamine synthase-like glycosyltransferase